MSMLHLVIECTNIYKLIEKTASNFTNLYQSAISPEVYESTADPVKGPKLVLWVSSSCTIQVNMEQYLIVVIMHIFLIIYNTEHFYMLIYHLDILL